ncbi:dienelactone hydrolase family protein [Rubrivirga sp.]|uniref:dienelactone hydrolase family protein n=1 Tax=Rubrivirga sp. TaxID=1885344 RepID=UPI003B51D323
MRAALLMLLALAACQPDDAAEMRRQHDGDTPTPTDAADARGLAVTTERVRYATVDGQPVTGVLARPDGAEAGLPAVVVVHEWWGLNGNVEAMAQRLADQGYVALAVDLYGGEVATTPDSAMALMRTAMGREAALTDNLRQAHAYLADDLGAPRVGVIGWCFGGMWSLRTALALPDQIDAAVVYYGRPVTDPARLATLTMPVLAFFGGADDSIPRDTVSAFVDALVEADVEHTVETYAGAPHAFANPSGQSYVPQAADDAWARTTAFFAETLRAAQGPTAAD